MRKAALLVLLGAAPAGAQDPSTEAYKLFFKEEIAPEWKTESMSEIRKVMLTGFQRHDVPDAAEWLMTDVLAKGEEGAIVREAVRVLCLYKTPETVARMAEVWERKLRKPWYAKALAALAFGTSKQKEIDEVLAKALKDRDERVVICACRAVGQGKKLAFRADLEKLVSHKHPLVRGAEMRALGELGGEESLPLIFKAFCGDASHRARYDAWIALRKLTLLELPCDPSQWAEFWQKRAGEVPEGEANPWGTSFPKFARNVGPASRFFGIPVLGDRICFVIDVSLDMANPFTVDIKAEREKPAEERIPNFFNVKTRWDLAIANVKECLDGLPEDVEFAVVFFSHEHTVWPDGGKFTKNRETARKQLIQHMEELKVGGSTAMFEGFRAGWGLLKDGNEDVNFDKGCDTILFVTDGRPTDGELKNRPDRLRDDAWRVAVPRALRIHAVGVHYHEYELLKALAKETGGLYVHAQQAGDTTEPQDLDFWPAKKKAFEEARKAKKGQ